MQCHRISLHPPKYEASQLSTWVCQAFEGEYTGCGETCLGLLRLVYIELTMNLNSACRSLVSKTPLLADPLAT